MINTMTLNRAKHVEDYNLAVKEYKVQLVAELKRLTSLAIEGHDVNHEINLTKPKSYQSVYDESIEMFEMTSEDQIALTHDEWRQLVQDKWTWRHDFETNTSHYAATAKTKML